MRGPTGGVPILRLVPCSEEPGELTPSALSPVQTRGASHQHPAMLAL